MIHHTSSPERDVSTSTNVPSKLRQPLGVPLPTEDAVRALGRPFDAQNTLDRLVDWMIGVIQEEGCPGAMIGISGTDSIVAFVVCARAFAAVGRGDRVVGVHYGKPFPPSGKTPEQVARMLELNPNMGWMPRMVLPWLRAVAPQAQVVEDGSFDHTNDQLRWGHLFQRALSGTHPTEPLDPSRVYWVVGTHTATEVALTTYSNLSCAVSVQPLQHLWKTEVLDICHALGVPQVAIDHSRQVDCDCGRFDLAAEHIQEIDMLLMARAGQIDPSVCVASMTQDLHQRLSAFIDEQVAYGAFKRRIPYTPPMGVVV